MHVLLGVKRTYIYGVSPTAVGCFSIQNRQQHYFFLQCKKVNISQSQEVIFLNKSFTFWCLANHWLAMKHAWLHFGCFSKCGTSTNSGNPNEDNWLVLCGFPRVVHERISELNVQIMFQWLHYCHFFFIPVHYICLKQFSWNELRFNAFASILFNTNI